MSHSKPSIDRARPVLALHGSASSGAQWQPLIKALEGERVVLAPDLPGYGKNAALSEYDAEARFSWLGEVIHSLGGRFDLVGHSFGGAVAMVLANRFPDQVCSVILYEPIVPPGSVIKDAPEMEELWSLWTRMMRLEVRDAMALFCDFWSGPESWARLSERAQDKLVSEFSSVMLDFRQVFTGQFDIGEPGYTGSLTILRGDASPPVARAMSERLSAGCDQAKVEILPGLGHLGPVTHADEVNRSIRRHLGCAAIAPKEGRWMTHDLHVSEDVLSSGP